LHVNEHALETQAGLALTTTVEHTAHVPPLPHALDDCPFAQLPDEQHPAPHEFPQVPQFAKSVCRLTHAPLQALKPLLQLKEQALASQAGVAFATVVVHAWPHVPQLFALLVTSTQVLPQSMGVDAGHPDAQADATQTGVLPLHAWPHDAQLFLSAVRSTQAPLQSV
jgi:hypothetical protein